MAVVFRGGRDYFRLSIVDKLDILEDLKADGFHLSWGVRDDITSAIFHKGVHETLAGLFPFQARQGMLKIMEYRQDVRDWRDKRWISRACAGRLFDMLDHYNGHCASVLDQPILEVDRQ